MRAHRHLALLAVGVFFSSEALAQIGTHTASAGPASNSWSVSIIADGYVTPHAEFFVSPIIATNRDWLHLEARYNDEDQSTGSMWFGYNCSGGRKLTWEVTPMIGGVFGRTTGIAPGFQASLSYKKFSLSSSGEYVFNIKHRNDSFFYSWPQLTYSPTKWLRAGLVAQRTKAYHSSLDTQRGLLVGFNYKKFEFTTYVFNLGWTQPTLIFEGGVSF
jgi:cytochrome c2